MIWVLYHEAIQKKKHTLLQIALVSKVPLHEIPERIFFKDIPDEKTLAFQSYFWDKKFYVSKVHQFTEL